MSWGAQISNFRRASSKNCTSHISVFSYLTVKITAPTAMHAEERNECRNGQEALKVRAGRLSISVRRRAHRTAQIIDLFLVEEYTTGFSLAPILIPSCWEAAQTTPNGVPERATFCSVFRNLNTSWSHKTSSMCYRRAKSTQWNTNF